MLNEETKPHTFREKLHEHWLTVVVLICIGTAGISWRVADELLVKPREFEIERLRRQLGELPPDVEIGFAVRAIKKQELADQITVFKATLKPGEAALTVDGNCLVQVTDINGDTVSAELTILQTANKVQIPRWKVGYAIQAFYEFPLLRFDYTFSLVEVRGNKATVVATRLNKSKPPSQPAEAKPGGNHKT